MIRKYHNHKLQTNPHKTPGKQIKQTNQLSLPHQDDLKTRMDMSNVQQNIEQLQTPAMGVAINNKLTTTEPPPWSDSTTLPWSPGHTSDGERY